MEDKRIKMDDMMPQNTDEAEIRLLLQRLNEAWGNADAFAALFTEDADYVIFDGSQVKGREAIAESHRPLFEGFMRGSHLEAQITALRFLTPEVALVHGKGAVVQRYQKKPSRRAISVQTNVVVKQNGRWLVAAFHNTRYRPWTESLMGKILLFLSTRNTRQGKER
jgi:uncharacterized protein (TIGR02246 family)